MLERFIPEPRLVEIDHVDMAGPPARAYAVARHFDLGRSSIARALFALRTLPDRLSGRAEGPLRLGVDDIASSGGFRMLADEPDQGFAVGAIGRFWEPEIPFARVGTAGFAAFDEPGFGKVAWEIRCGPGVLGRVEHRQPLGVDGGGEQRVRGALPPGGGQGAGQLVERLGLDLW